MATKNKKIEELLNEVKPMWICPITKKSFDINNVDEIEKHKKELLKKEKQKEDADNLTKEFNRVLKIVNNNFKNVSSLSELNDNIGLLAKVFNGTLELSVPKGSDVKNVNPNFGKYFDSNICFKINSSKIKPVIATKILRSIFKDITKEQKNGSDYIFTNIDKIYNSSFKSLMKKIKNYQSLGNKIRTKEGIDLINKNPDYTKLRKELDKVGKQIHDLKSVALELQNKMAYIREKTNDFSFEKYEKSLNQESPIDTKSKKKKM